MANSHVRQQLQNAEVVGAWKLHSDAGRAGAAKTGLLQFLQWLRFLVVKHKHYMRMRHEKQA